MAKLVDHKRRQKGFTLIELSIVLVVIGLIVGGVLVGQDLIRSAAVRAQVSQIERFNVAANTFRSKYGYLPGDISATAASAFGFAARQACGTGPAPASGDGNGVIEGIYSNVCTQTTYASGYSNPAGETGMFWVDLTSANGMNLNLIEGNFSSGRFSQTPGVSATNWAPYFPAAKAGGNTFVLVFSQGATNYFELMAAADINPGGVAYNSVPNALAVRTAYSIDAKIDDGLPQTGAVTAGYLNSWWLWADNDNGPGDGTATPPSASTCYDDGGVTGATRRYSVKTNSGAGVNCALAFRFQ